MSEFTAVRDPEIVQIESLARRDGRVAVDALPAVLNSLTTDALSDV